MNGSHALTAMLAVQAHAQATEAAKRGDYVLAEQLHHKHILLREGCVGPNSYHTLRSYCALGEFYTRCVAGRLDEAQHWLSKAVARLNFLDKTDDYVGRVWPKSTKRRVICIAREI